MKNIIQSIFLLLAAVTYGQTSYTKGEIIDSIAVIGSENETFTLYLPTTFSAEKLAPIVIIFEPAGRGKVGLSPFIKAAEKYGHVLVCSNDSRNGPYDRNFGIANRLFTHLFSQFTIDPEQVFLSGFSGGARLATSIASLSDEITGVIGCGAGLSMQPGNMPYDSKFLYAGICGTRDMNYIEMLELMPLLERLKFSKTLFTFDDGHRWPPEEKIVEAFDWLYVALHKKGTVALDGDTLKNLYLSNYEKAMDKLKGEDILGGVGDFTRIRESFGSSYHLDSISQKLIKVRGLPAYKKGLKERNMALAMERKLTTLYFERINSEFKAPETAAMGWWRKQLEKLNKQFEKGGPEIKRMIQRLRFKLFASLYERTSPSLNPNEQKEQKNYSIALRELIRETTPEDYLR
jgi:hypothetical protein